MSNEEKIPDMSDILSQSDIDALMEQTAPSTEQAVYHANGELFEESNELPVESYDFRNPAFLTEVEMRQVRIRHEQFIYYLAARLSMYLRMDAELQMSQLATQPYSLFTSNLPNPAFISLFKMEELNGVGILNITPRLAMTIVDRLLGGRGHSVRSERYLTELEIALMGDIIQAIIEEWVRQWADIQEMNPTIIGHENNGRFLQTAASDAIMLSITIDVMLGDCSEPMHIGIPYYTMEPVIRKLQARNRSFAGSIDQLNGVRWREAYDEIDMLVDAEWDAMESTVGDILSWQPGDLLVLPQTILQDTRLRIKGCDRFKGEIGLEDDGQVSVRITEGNNPLAEGKTND